MVRSKFRRYAIGAGTFATALSIGFVFQYGDAVAARLSGTPVESSPDVAQEETTLVPVTASVVASANVIEPQSSIELPTELPAEVALTETPAVEEQITPSIAVAGGELEVATAVEVDTPFVDEAPNLDAVVANVALTPVEIDEPAEIALADANVQDDIMSKGFELDLGAPTVELVTDATGTDVSSEPIADDAFSLEADVVAEVECSLGAFAIAQSGAMVTLHIDAPCQIQQAFVVEHEGVLITGETDDLGLAQIDIPALAEVAAFGVTFSEGAETTAKVDVPDLSDYARSVLFWEGARGFELHAFHGDATYGAEGHVWKGSATDEVAFYSASNGEYSLEVYTVAMDAAADLQLNVEAEVNAENCGRPVQAKTMRFNAIQLLTNADLELTMPDCDAIGEYLVLKNMFEDLTIAAR